MSRNTAGKPASPIIPTMTGLSDGEAIPSMWLEWNSTAQSGQNVIEVILKYSVYKSPASTDHAQPSQINIKLPRRGSWSVFLVAYHRGS